MGQTLPHGVYLPDNGERNCYVGLSQNWQKLDNLIGSHGDKVSFAQTLTEGVEIGKITINGVEVSLYHTDYSDKADADNVYTKAEADTLLSAKAKASDLTAHTSNADIHVTTSDKAKWHSKQDALSSQQIANIADVTNKANDSDVVHKSGNETISGTKTFTVGVTSNVLRQASDDKYMSIFGGSDPFRGAWIELVGKDNPATALAGAFEIIASNGNSVRKSLCGYPNGSLTWSGSSFTCTNGDLGTSTHKWKTLNGVDIGALSLPTTNVIDKTSSLTKSGDVISIEIDGWLEIRASANTSNGYLLLYSYPGMSVKATAPNDTLIVHVPVGKGFGVTVYYGDVSIYVCRLLPCQGNV